MREETINKNELKTYCFFASRLTSLVGGSVYVQYSSGNKHKYVSIDIGKVTKMIISLHRCLISAVPLK